MRRISYVLLHIFTWSELSAQRAEELCPAKYTQTPLVPWANLLEPNRQGFTYFVDLSTLPDYSFVNSPKLKVTIMASWYRAVFTIIDVCRENQSVSIP